jgi:hypothetical protein
VFKLAIESIISILVTILLLYLLKPASVLVTSLSASESNGTNFTVLLVLF